MSHDERMKTCNVWWRKTQKGLIAGGPDCEQCPKKPDFVLLYHQNTLPFFLCASHKEEWLIHKDSRVGKFISLNEWIVQSVMSS